jgi:branched-chain amino acid transport system ATP-binding protein
VTLLELRGLVAGYGGGRVLHGVDLELGRGRTLALLGRNGVGKSTLVMTIMGLLRPTAGRLNIDGVDLTGRRPHEIARAGVALVPQGRRIWPTLTVEEHLLMAARAKRAKQTPWSPRALYELLPGLAERRWQTAGSLSGGEQQMLAIARALATGPALLLMDEPSEGLAPLIVDRIAELIRDLAAAGTAILLVEQDLHLAFGVADEIAVMTRGSIVHRGETAAFRSDPDKARRLLGVEA